MRSAIFLFCLALLGSQTFGASTTNDLLEKYLGTYESQPGNDQNFGEFVQPFQFLAHVSLDKPNIIYLKKDGEYYTVGLVFGPNIPHFVAKLNSGETQTAEFLGRTFEYVHIIDHRGDTAVLRSSFRDTESDFKFTTDATFTLTEIKVTYTREGVIARRTYVRIPCPCIAGNYENVPEKQSLNFVEFANAFIPTPKGVSWDDNSGIWISRYMSGRHFVLKNLITPSVVVKYIFILNEKQIQQIGGNNVTYVFTLEDEDHETTTTTLHGEFTSEAGKHTLDAVITPEGITTTYKTGDKTATRYWKRVLHAYAYGTFEAVPESAENYSEFAKVAGKPDDSTDKTQFQFYKQGGSTYFRIIYDNGKSLVHLFELNRTFEVLGGPSGTVVKYTFNERPNYSSLYPTLVLDYHIGDKTVTETVTFNASGAAAIYSSGGVTARRFYRRQLPTFALGKFHSNLATPEFTAFTEIVGLPELAAQTTVELAQTPEGFYNQRLFVEGAPEPQDLRFTLGQLTNVTLKGRSLIYNHFYFEQPTPVLHTYWNEVNKGPLTLSISAEFNPTGYTATYIYYGILATRTYTRVGAPVEMPTYPVALIQDLPL